MSKDINDFIDDIQKEIFDEAKDVLGEEGFERWLNPRYRGGIKNPDAHARIKGVCGDTMEIFLKFEENHVKEASYLTDGCSSSSICGSFAAELAIGKSPDELFDVTGESILKKLGNIAKEEQHCAFLAAETLREALNDYMIMQVKRDK